MEDKKAVETITIVEGRTPAEDTEDCERKQNGNAGNGMDDDQDMFHSFTPLSFDSLIPKINLTIHHVQLQFNNLPNTPLLQSLLPWSHSVCQRLLLTQREFNFYSAEHEKTLLIPHKLISLHGITTATTTNSENTGKSAIYCQLDLNLAETCQSNGQTDNPSLEEDPSVLTSSPDPIELIITPTDLSLGQDGELNLEEKNEKMKKIVQDLYDSISTCISLNPLPTIGNGSELGGVRDATFEIDDSLISAFLDNSNDDAMIDQDGSTHQVDPSNRFHPY